MKKPANSEEGAGRRGPPGRRRVGLALSPILVSLSLGLVSCASTVDTALGPDGSARVEVSASIPDLAAAKFRKLAQIGPDAALFDGPAIEKSLASRPGVKLLSLAAPTPSSLRASVAIRDLEVFARSPEFLDTGLLALKSGPGWVELRVRLERGQAAALSKLFPGIDPYVLDALSPPALEEEPVTVAEYRSMLASVLGASAIPALDSAAIDLTFTAPGPVLDSGGGELRGSKLRVNIPLLDALVLEKPIEFWLRWKRTT